MSETPLEMARRHVVEGEARCARQAEILREMIVHNHPHAAEMAQSVLAGLEDTLTTLRERVRLEEQIAAQEGESDAAATKPAS